MTNKRNMAQPMQRMKKIMSCNLFIVVKANPPVLAICHSGDIGSRVGELLYHNDIK